MADSPNLPGSHAWPPKSPGEWRDFYGFLRDLVRFVRQTSGNSDSLTALEERITALENAPEPDLGQIFGDMSVSVLGLLGQVVQVRLVNDTVTPGTTYYYGTNADGTKGWHLLGDALLEGVGITLTVDGTTGEITIAHGDTSSVANLSTDLSDGVVIQDLSATFDTFGHVQTIATGSVNLDLRYGQLATTNTWAQPQTFTTAPVFTDASGTRTALGATTVGANLFTLPNPSAIRFLRINADNSVSALTQAAMQTALDVYSIGAVDTITGAVLSSANAYSDTGIANFLAAAHTWPLTQTFSLSPIISTGATNALFVLDANAATARRMVIREAGGNRWQFGADGSSNLILQSYNSSAVLVGNVFSVPMGTQTLAFTVGFTAPTADINGGTVDGTVIGASSAAAATVATLTNTQSEVQSGIESPASFGANTDNLAIASTTRIVRLQSSGAFDLTGIVAPSTNRRLTLINVGANNITLTHNATSTAANQFRCPGGASFVLNNNDAVDLWYDLATARWRVLGF